MTQGDAKWEQMTDAEFLADYAAKHGADAAAKVAKVIGMDPPPHKQPNNAKHPAVVGHKPVKRKAIPRAKAGPTWQERRDAERAEGPEPERARIVEARFDGDCKADTCKVGDRRFLKSDEVVQLRPSRRMVHGVCAHEAARDRIRQWERYQAQKESDDG